MVTRASAKMLRGAHIRIGPKRFKEKYKGKQLWASVLAVAISLLLPTAAFTADWEASVCARLFSIIPRFPSDNKQPSDCDNAQ